MCGLLLEILKGTLLEDEERLREILEEEYSQMESEIEEDGYSIALQRAMAGLSEASLAGQYLSGTEYFWFLKDLLEDFETRKEELIRNLQTVRSVILQKKHMELSLIHI